ncbi:hypothetical protein [Ralstonia mannitolilytica]|uniref:hypothetical protein n=1 Tax=Ralstonia mannitolilytica TaxID=105219 RepID=UPI003B83EA55
MKRTVEEILAEIQRIGADDIFGFSTGDLVQALPFEAAKPFLKEGVTADQWTQSTDPEKEIRDYMSFAWGKANNCRGLSAGRSVEHMQAWLWLDGKEELSKRLDDVYEFYGKPCLVLVCKEYGINWRALDDGNWTNSEDADGMSAEEALRMKGLWEEISVPA